MQIDWTNEYFEVDYLSSSSVKPWSSQFNDTVAIVESRITKNYDQNYLPKIKNRAVYLDRNTNTLNVSIITVLLYP